MNFQNANAMNNTNNANNANAMNSNNANNAMNKTDNSFNIPSYVLDSLSSCPDCYLLFEEGSSDKELTLYEATSIVEEHIQNHSAVYHFPNFILPSCKKEVYESDCGNFYLWKVEIGGHYFYFIDNWKGRPYCTRQNIPLDSYYRYLYFNEHNWKRIL